MNEHTIVPTLNSYADQPGYYIRARPSSVDAPITYQIESEGYSIIDSYGVLDGEQISWSIIQSLKSLGLLYTDESGVIGADEFEPDASQLEETALGDEDARQLAVVIAKNLDIDEEALRAILDILNIDPSTFNFPETISQSGSESPTLGGHSSTPDFPVHDNIDVLDGETIYKTSDWWKAAVLAAGYSDSEVLVYLWRKDSNLWKRKQKYKITPDDWAKERSIINGLIAKTQ